MSRLLVLAVLSVALTGILLERNSPTRVGASVPTTEAAATTDTTRSPLAASPSELPNPAITPGGILTTSAAMVCTPGWAARHRRVTTAQRRVVFAAYGIAYAQHRGYEVDHLVSLELGGSNATRNLWPEPHAGALGSYTKDRLENRLHALVCAGRVRLVDAQRWEATNWVDAARRLRITRP